MGKNVLKNLETGWSLSLHPENLTRQDMKSIASDLFFLGNHYKYIPEDRKIHGALTSKPFMVHVNEVWSLYNSDYSTLHARSNATNAVSNDYTAKQCIIKDSDLLGLVPEDGCLNKNMIAFVWHW